MKKPFKAISFFLTAALIFSVFVLVVSANAALGTENAGQTKDDASNIGAYSSGSGKGTVVLEGDNYYKNFTSTGTGNVGNDAVIGETWYSQDGTHKYIVQELDVSTDSQLPNNLGFFSIMNCYVNGSLNSSYQQNFNGKFLDFDKNSHLYINYSNVTEPVFSKDKWVRLSLVYEFICKELTAADGTYTPEEYYDFADSKIYLYADGVLIKTYSIQSASRYQLKSDISNVTVKCHRMNVANATEGRSLCLDDTRLATYVTDTALSENDRLKLITENDKPSRTTAPAEITPVENATWTTSDGSIIGKYAGTVTGKGEIVTEADGSLNQYKVFTGDGSGTTGSSFTPNETWYDADNNVKYIAMELDISTDSMIPNENNFSFSIPCYTSTDFNKSWQLGFNGKIVDNDVDSGISHLYANYSNIPSVTFSKDKWVRVSFVFEFVRKDMSADDGDFLASDYYDFGDSKLYLYIDGALIKTYAFDTVARGRYQLKSNIENVMVSSLNLTNAATPADRSLCIDDTRLATYVTDTALSENDRLKLITENDKPARATAIASVNGVDCFTEEALVNAIKSAEAGSVSAVVLKSDITTLLETSGKSLTLDTAGYKFTGFAPGYYTVASADGVYTVTQEDKATFKPFDVKYNLSLFTDYNMNFYVSSADATEKNVVFVSDYNNLTEKLASTTAIVTALGGGEYSISSIKVGTADTATYTMYAIYEVDGVKCGFPVIYDIPTYAGAVMGDANVPAKGKTLVMALVDYANKVLVAAGKEANATYASLLTTYRDDYLTTASDFGEAVNTVEGGSMSVYFSTDVTSFAFKPTEAVDSVTFKIGNSGIFDAVKLEDGTYLFKTPARETNEQKMADMYKTLTITVNGENEYTYNLAAYIASLDEVEDANYLAAAKALYAYSKAAEAYVN